MDDKYIDRYGELFIKYKRYLPGITFEKFLDSPELRTKIICKFAVDSLRDVLMKRNGYWG